VHPASGIGWSYAGLLRHLGPEYPVYALQAPRIARPHLAVPEFDRLVEDYLGLVRQVRPDGPYRLLGWSFGGAIAYAMATALQAEGAQVELLVLLDSYPGHGGPEPELDGEAALAALVEGHGLTPRPGVDGRTLLATSFPMLDEDRLDTIVEVYAAHRVLAAAFRPARFHGDVELFAATAAESWERPDPELWQPHVTGKVRIHPVDFRHADLAGPAALAVIGPVLAARLADLDHRATD
jgi:thioesterase domain-containing protein